MTKFMLLCISLCIILFACTQKSYQSSELDTIAKSYVKLMLEIGEYDSDFVDAYYGPENLKPDAASKKDDSSFEKLKTRIDALNSEISAIDVTNLDDMQQARVKYLHKQLIAAAARLDYSSGTTKPFDEESALQYDAVAPTHDEAHFKDLLHALNDILPGHGSITTRLSEFKKDFIIPKAKLDAVFQAAISEARKRTNLHFDLPENENFHVEYVTDKSWSAYNWYKGNSYSLIQVNTDLPIYIDRAIDLACHEGYPGHHVYNALLEKNLVVNRNWVEFSVYPLFSPQSLIAEGSANYGIDVAFPGEERIAFEKETLFPLASIDPAGAEKYYEIFALTKKLSYAGNEAARQFLDGKISRQQAIDWLIKYALMAPDRAAQRLRFIEKYRSYVINYNWGQDLVRKWIEKQGGTDEHPEQRWQIFGKLLSNPYIPSDLK
ncbi:MAG: hypothetical protein DWQ10_08685 [Calditrichaeota bacterium]|nr:MAG: hypothetical protein DWQ10_08685 [Calditrichota bacterium]